MKHRPPRSLREALVRAFFRAVFYTGLFAMVHTLTSYLVPTIVSR